MKYKIVKSDPTIDTLEDFENQVNEYMEIGWKLQDGIVILSVEIGDKNRLGTQFFQTMHKQD